MRYNITYKNGEVKNCELTESAFDKLISEHFDEIDLITEDDDFENVSVDEAVGFDYYGPIQLPNEDEGTFRIYYNGGNGDEQYLKKSRNGRFVWLDKHNFDYANGEKPFETNDYKLALQLIDKFGGTVKKIKDVNEAINSNTAYDMAYEEAYTMWNNAGLYEEELYTICQGVANKFGVNVDKLYNDIKKAEQYDEDNWNKVDEATEIEPDMFDSEYDKKYIDGRRTLTFYDVYEAMEKIAPKFAYVDDKMVGNELNLVYYPNSGAYSKEEFERIKREMNDKFGNAITVKTAQAQYAPEQRKLYIGFIPTPDEEDVDESIDVVGKERNKEDKNSWFDKSGIAESDDLNIEMSSPIETVKEYIDYLYTHNKNYTREQWNIIEDIKEAIDNNSDVEDLENKIYILSHHNKNYNRAQYNLITELEEILKKNNYSVKFNSDINEGIKDSFKKAGKLARNAIAAGAIAGGLMGNPADAKGQDFEQPVAVEQRIDGTIVDQYGNEFTQEQWEALERGEDPYADGATQPVEEDTVKSGSGWTNKGKEGTHGKFKTKKTADAQRKAMFANGYVAEADIDLTKYHNDAKHPVRGSSDYPEGNPDRNPKIDIYVNGEYVATTKWAKTAKSAKERYLAKYPELSPESVKTRIVKENMLKENLEDYIFEPELGMKYAYNFAMDYKMDGLARALDMGSNKDIQRELCKYVERIADTENWNIEKMKARIMATDYVGRDNSVNESIFDDMDKDINKFYNDADEFIKKQKDDKDAIFFVKDPNEYTGEDEITAVFPNDIADSEGNVTVYAHMGQHSAGDLDYMLSLPEANPEEYSDLLQELNNIGYTNLNIISKDEVSKVDESCKVNESDFGLEDDADWMKARLKDVKHIKAKLDAETNPEEKEELKRDYDFARKEFIKLYGREDLVESEMPINDVEVDKDVLSLEPSTKGWELLDLTGIMNKIEKAESPLSDDNINDNLDDAKMNDKDNKAEKADMDIKSNSKKENDKKEIKESFIIR